MRACDTLLPALADAFSVTVGQAAQTVFIFAIAYGVCQLGFGPLGDRYGKLRVIALCALACVFGNLMAFMAPDLNWLVAARVLSGGCAAGIYPLAMAWIGDNVPYAARQLALARLVTASVTGVLAGQWVSGLIAQWLDWRLVFALLALLFLIAGGLLLRVARFDVAPLRSARKGFHVLVDILSLPPARWILIVTAIEGAFAFGAVAFIPSFLQVHHGVSLAMAGGIAAFYGVGGFIYTRLAAWLLRRIGESGLALLGGLMLGLGLVSLAYVPWLGWTPLACMMAGFGFYGLHNTLQTHATQMAPAMRGTAMSLFACCLFLGQSVGIMAAAWVADHLATALIFAGAGVGLLGVALLLSWHIRPRPARDAAD